jgi:hypothetical protein
LPGSQPSAAELRFEQTIFFHLLKGFIMPCGKKRKRHKIATHKRKKRLRKNRHKKKNR